MARPWAADQSEVRDFVIEAIAHDGRNLSKQIQDRFDVARPTASKYIKTLVDENILRRTKPGKYELIQQENIVYLPLEGLQEHVVWIEDIQPLLAGLPSNVQEIWQHGCTEMINNAVDHSEGRNLTVSVEGDPIKTIITVYDDGIGIFRKIADALDLEDDRHAVLELAKGKFTTDPANHTGEGIFFTSRMFDDYDINSGDVFFKHYQETDQDWILGEEHRSNPPRRGTYVYMALNNKSDRELQDIFDQYADEDGDYAFDKTVVPVKLLSYGDERLVSRSQAKRLLARFERFRTVVLNFEGVDSIGQAFADEVFRVFRLQHPNVELIPINANERVSQMITRAFRPAGN